MILYTQLLCIYYLYIYSKFFSTSYPYKHPFESQHNKSFESLENLHIKNIMPILIIFRTYFDYKSNIYNYLSYPPRTK